MKHRYAGRCACGVDLAADTPAGWDKAARRVLCEACVADLAAGPAADSARLTLMAASPDLGAASEARPSSGGADSSPGLGHAPPGEQPVDVDRPGSSLEQETVIVEHLVYDALEDRFEATIFTENQTKQDLSCAVNRLTKHICDYVVADSKIERSFVTELDANNEVAVYAKLPRGFFIPAPVGNYNPGWAIAFTEGSVKHVHFVAETKGLLRTLQLKGVEVTKIECARKFCASLNEKHDQGVKYDVVTDYAELMQLVAR